MRKAERIDLDPAERPCGQRQQRAARPSHRYSQGLARAAAAGAAGARRRPDAPGEMILNDAERHEEAGGGEAGARTDELLRLARDDRPERRADVDAHVEHGESGVEPGAAFGVEFRDHGAHVRLQQTHAEDDDEQAEIERPGLSEVARMALPERDADAPDEYGAPRADQPVGDPAAGERCEIDARGVKAVDRRGGLVVDAEAALRRPRRPGRAPVRRACRNR